MKNIYEPQHDKTNKMTCVRASKDSDQLYTHWVAKDPMFLHAVKTLIRLGGIPGEGKTGWIVELHVRSAFLLIVLVHMALF